ncbi:MAG: hypothetical protein ACFFDT_36465, partial [Candidatus Hodarchaeota archaeon]
MTFSSRDSHTTQIRQRILNHLTENPEILRCIRGFQKNREKVFLNRIEEFNGFLISENITNDGRLFHHVALQAALNFIAQYPNIDHTPSSLRALFSVPTRRNRKKGKHSGKALRDQAMALKINSDISAYDSLLVKIHHTEVGDSLLNAKKSLLRKLEEIIQRSSPPFHPQNLENDHSEQDLNRTIDYISSIIPEVEFLTLDPDE